MSSAENTYNPGSTGNIQPVPNKIFAALNWLDRNIDKPALIVGMLAIILIITYQTFFRYIITYTNSPETAGALQDAFRYILYDVLNFSGNITWTEETSRFIFIWISYLAIPIAIRQRSNIRVDIVYDKLPEEWRRILWITMDILFLAFAAVVFAMGVDDIAAKITHPQTTPALGIPFAVPYMILPISFALMCIRLVQDAVIEAKKGALKEPFYALLIAAAVAMPVLVYSEYNPLTLLFGYFITLLIIGVPVAVSLGLSAMATILGAGTLPIGYVATTAFTSIDSFPIMAIPFFIATGVFMGAGGLSQRLLTLADEILGSLHGGLALGTVGTCMFFAAISGSGPATVAAIGSLTIPAMIARGYDKLFSASIVAAAGAIGVMIPPSNPFVVYGISASAPIDKLFLGGIIPGVLTGLVLMVYSYFYCRKKGWQGNVRHRSLKTFLNAFWDAKWALMVPVIVLGGIYGGLMTPTEAAAVAAFYGLVVGCAVYREISIKKLFDCLVESCSMSAIIIILMSMATIFGQIMTLEDVPTTIATWILSFTSSKIMILLMINVLLLIVGTFMEALAAIVILTPILWPIAESVGVDKVHFGVIMVVNLAIGFITPPVGVNLFVASGIANAKITDLARVSLPLLALMIGVLLVITYVPAIPMFLVW